MIKVSRVNGARELDPYLGRATEVCSHGGSEPITLLKTASASSLVDAVTMTNGIGPGIGAARILAGRPAMASLDLFLPGIHGDVESLFASVKLKCPSDHCPTDNSWQLNNRTLEIIQLISWQGITPDFLVVFAAMASLDLSYKRIPFISDDNDDESGLNRIGHRDYMIRILAWQITVILQPWRGRLSLCLDLFADLSL
ncbi:hypothetical protein H5410_034898 [Solanum commersonii]|uniref:Uncharacterized protein n=1 Tax=Solanum commersonii TaxID=4109 RepID=A0A9J5Y120_SOLCO|nr:hypothetical protein H5410_034898 [Solanum commersonii]